MRKEMRQAKELKIIGLKFISKLNYEQWKGILSLPSRHGVFFCAEIWENVSEKY